MKKLNIGVFFKTATAGLIDWRSPSEAEHQPHIVQLAAHQVDLDAGNILQSMNVIVHPSSWVIPAEATAIHGIDTELAKRVGIPEANAISMFINLLGDCKAETLHTRIAHGIAFDDRIIRIGLKRYFGSRIANEFKESPSQCTGQLSKLSMETKKIPALGEALNHFTRRDLQDIHTAFMDVNACMDVYFAIKQLEANAA